MDVITEARAAGRSAIAESIARRVAADHPGVPPLSWSITTDGRLSGLVPEGPWDEDTRRAYEAAVEALQLAGPEVEADGALVRQGTACGVPAEVWMVVDRREFERAG